MTKMTEKCLLKTYRRADEQKKYPLEKNTRESTISYAVAVGKVRNESFLTCGGLSKNSRTTKKQIKQMTMTGDKISCKHTTIHHFLTLQTRYHTLYYTPTHFTYYTGQFLGFFSCLNWHQNTTNNSYQDTNHHSYSLLKLTEILILGSYHAKRQMGLDKLIEVGTFQTRNKKKKEIKVFLEAIIVS